VSAFADLNELGTDENLVVNLAYGPGRLAQAYISILSELPNEAVICGTKGSIRFASPFWPPVKFTLHLNGKAPETFEFPLPQIRQGHSFNFTNSVGLHYQAAYAQRLLAGGRLESDLQPLSESLTIMETMDEIRRQIGLKYPGEA